MQLIVRHNHTRKVIYNFNSNMSAPSATHCRDRYVEECDMVTQKRTRVSNYGTKKLQNKY